MHCHLDIMGPLGSPLSQPPRPVERDLAGACGPVPGLFKGQRGGWADLRTHSCSNPRGNGGSHAPRPKRPAWCTIHRCEAGSRDAAAHARAILCPAPHTTCNCQTHPFLPPRQPCPQALAPFVVGPPRNTRTRLPWGSCRAGGALAPPSALAPPPAWAAPASSARPASRATPRHLQ